MGEKFRLCKTIVFAAALVTVSCLGGRAHAATRQYTSDYSDLVATVEDGEENEVYFSTFSLDSSNTTVGMMFVNTSKDVTIKMKAGVQSTKDCVYVMTPRQTNEARHIILEDVVIDRSSQELFFQWADLANGGISDTGMAALSAIYYPGEVYVTGANGAKDYRGKLRITLKGNNVLKGARSSNSTQSYGDIYTPGVDDVLSGIWAMNLDIDGDGMLDVSGQEYGIYTKKSLTIGGGCIMASGSRKKINASSAKLIGGSYADEKLYGFKVYNGTLDNGEIPLCEKVVNTDAATKDTYPYTIKYTDKATAYLSTMIARNCISRLENGDNYVSSYDIGLTSLDGYKSGNYVSVDYGMNYGFDMSQSLTVVNALRNDHPEYWWLWQNSVSPGTDGATIMLENGYSYSKVVSGNEKFEKAVNKVLLSSGVTESMTDYQKAYVLYQALAAHVSYDLGYMDQSANSAFIYGKAVCDGYAKAYIHLLRKAGVSASYVEGWGVPGDGQGGAHAWVIVKCDGKYYYCDPTWDGLGDTATFNNFMLDENDISQQHTVYRDDMGYDLPASASSTLALQQTTRRVYSTAVAGGNVYPSDIQVVANSPVRITVIPEEDKTIDTITINGAAVTFTEDADGSFYHIIDSCSANVEITVSYKVGSKVSTKLEPNKSSLSIKAGAKANGSVKLTTNADVPLSDKIISFQIKKGDVTVDSTGATTDDNGEAAFSFAGLAEGEYLIVAEYAGQEGYRASKTEIALSILKESVYTAGDFVLSRTGGGTLEVGVDYSYTEDENIPGSGILLIKSDAPMTISMSEASIESDDRIMIAESAGTNVKLTLSNVHIDRSAIAVTGTEKAYDESYNLVAGGERNMLLTAALSAESKSQQVSIVLEGDNMLSGSATGSKVDYFATIYNGEYIFSGMGSLAVNSGLSEANDVTSVDNYGLYCNGMKVKGGNISIVSEATDKVYMSYATGVKIDGVGSYTQLAGTVSIKAGKGLSDAKGLFCNAGISSSNFNMKGGSLNIETSKSSTDPADYVIAYHAAIWSNNVNISDGDIVADGDVYGINAVTTLSIKNATLTATGTTANVKIPNTATIESGLFNEGDVDARTVYGCTIANDSIIASEVKDGKTLYRVTSKYVKGLVITGGLIGDDYEYEQGKVKILSDTPLTIGMADGVDVASDIIVADVDENMTYNITLDNVKIDRSNVTFVDVGTYMTDAVIDVAKGNLKLTVKGDNEISGSTLRSGAGGLNTGIYVEYGKLTVSGKGKLKITEPNSSYFSTGIVAGEVVMNGGTLDVISGKEGVGFRSVKVQIYNGNKIAGNGNFTMNGGTLKATIPGGDSLDNDYTTGAALSVDGKLTINDGNVIASMGETVGASHGIYAGGDIVIKNGSIDATAGTGGIESYAIATDSDFVVTGGKIKATGKTGAIKCNPVIKGGYFAVGDETVGTIYGLAIAANYKVVKGDDADYPYNVVDDGSGNQQSQDPVIKDPDTSGGDKQGTNPDTVSQGGNSSQGGNQEVIAVEVKKGSIIESSSDTTATYKVSKSSIDALGQKVVEVEYTKQNDSAKKSTAVVVSDKIVLDDGTIAKITSVAKEAFSKNTKITKVTLGKNITTIGTKAFSGDKKLKTITIKSKDLKKIGKNAFSGINKKAVIKVPKSLTKKQFNAYKKMIRNAGAPKTVKIKKG
ncbi:MAG: hypothetical protein E7271_05620 [Lachnospiraceae bacterium]|jgi:hypothetical protein|nr:hypothetical protein [Lachnospiraceae bacterium]